MERAAVEDLVVGGEHGGVGEGTGGADEVWGLIGGLVGVWRGGIVLGTYGAL